MPYINLRLIFVDHNKFPQIKKITGMQFLLVEWVEEPKTYSVVSKDRLIDGTLRALSKELIGKVVGVFWRGKKVFMCTILETGKHAVIKIYVF